jgi:NTE family protein
MVNNLPVSVVRAMGADIVIAVDISMPLLTEEKLTSFLSVTEQLTGFLTRRNTELQIQSLGAEDILIIPELGDFSSADFEGAEEIVHLGYEAALASKESLAMLARPDYEALARPGPEKESGNIVHFIDIDNGSVLKDELIRSRVALELGQPLNLGKLDKSVDQIYSLDVFESVTYDLVRNDQGERGVVIHASPRSWGPNYFQLGLELSSDFSESSDFKLGAAYTHNALNSMGGELQVIGSIGRQDEISFDFYQPIDLQANWYVQPQIFWRRQNDRYWEEDVNTAKL